jgi:predicted lipoprotein with Yx(FWY)xxD motif
MRNRWWLVGSGLAAAAVVVTACGSNSPTDPASSGLGLSATSHNNAGTSTLTIKTDKTSKGTVLTVNGRTVYWFAKDTKTQSNCNGSCASYWPPVLGKVVAAAGTSLPHGFGTIKRADGKTQATYDGHPLYTYVGDTSAGQIKGNGVTLSGGLWWAMTPSGTILTSSSKKSSSSSSGSSGSSGGGSGW